MTLIRPHLKAANSLSCWAVCLPWWTLRKNKTSPWAKTKPPPSPEWKPQQSPSWMPGSMSPGPRNVPVPEEGLCSCGSRALEMLWKTITCKPKHWPVSQRLSIQSNRALLMQGQLSFSWAMSELFSLLLLFLNYCWGGFARLAEVIWTDSFDFEMFTRCWLFGKWWYLTPKDLPPLAPGILNHQWCLKHSLAPVSRFETISSGKDCEDLT